MSCSWVIFYLTMIIAENQFQTYYEKWINIRYSFIKSDKWLQSCFHQSNVRTDTLSIYLRKRVLIRAFSLKPTRFLILLKIILTKTTEVYTKFPCYGKILYNLWKWLTLKFLMYICWVHSLSVLWTQVVLLRTNYFILTFQAKNYYFTKISYLVGYFGIFQWILLCYRTKCNPVWPRWNSSS